jgi:superfamily II DNA or RNA helicase
MITIEYGNVTCKVNNLTDSTIKYEIANKLSYETGGFGAPKQLHVIFNPKTCISYTGLIPYIINILKKHKLEVQLIDKRIEPESNANFNIVDGIVPRDYQQNVFDNARSRMIVQMATGAGKTLVLAGMISQFDVKPVIVMSPKATLAYQLRDEIAKFLGVKVGILTGSEKDIQDITVATPQTALKSEVLPKAKALLVDECQFLGSHTLFMVARMARNAYYRCAVSATPWRDGTDDMLIEASINVRNPKSNVNATTLIKKGKLTPCEINFIEQEENCQWLGSYAKTYNCAIVNNTSRNNKIMKLVKSSIDKNLGSILVLINKIEHGNMLLNRIRKEINDETFEFVHNGKTFTLHHSEFISGVTSMEERMAILEASRQEKVTILIGSTIADEGLDVPALKVLILAGSGKSSTRAFQRVGRVLRLFKGRNKAYVYDFMDMIPTFYKHYLYRKALYCTEPAWKNNMHWIKVF